MQAVSKAVSLGGMVTIDGASKAKGVPYTTLYRWIVRNNVPRVRIGATFMVKLDDLSGYRPRY